MLTIEGTVLYKMRIKMKTTNFTKIITLSICLLSLGACSNTTKNPMSILPASALSLIQLDAQKNPNMSKENQGVKKDSALALAMARINKTKDSKIEEVVTENKGKIVTVYIDQDTPDKLYADVHLLQLKNWTVEKITVGPIETEVSGEDANLSINSVLNAHSFTKEIRTENNNISIQYDETLPTSSINVEMKKTSHDDNAEILNA